MKSILQFEILLPILLLIIQTLVHLFICLFVLKRIRLLKTPYAGMEYSQVIVATSILAGVFFISTADVAGLFQTFKTFQNAGSDILFNTLKNFGQLTLITFLLEIAFGLTSFLIIKLLFGFKNTLGEVKEGNMPASILMSIIILGFSLIFQTATKEILEYTIPQYIIL